MDKYFDKFYTPLKYHKFLKFVGLPLSFLLALLGLFSMVLGDGAPLDSLRIVDLVYQFVSTFVLGIALYGFYTWKPCGFYGVLANQGLGVLYSIYAIGIYAQQAPDMIASTVGDLLGRGVIAVLVTIYYCKRRPLFFPEMQEEYMAKLVAQPAPVSDRTPVDKSQGDPSRCRVCGEQLNFGRSACMKCGTSFPGAVQQEDRPKFCRRCGHPLTDDSNFCRRCGEKVL